MTGVQVMGDLSWLLGTIAAEVLAEVVLHMTLAWLPVVGILITGARLLWREGENPRTGAQQNRRGNSQRAGGKTRVHEGRKIRQQIERNFTRFLSTISGSF